MKLIVDCPDLSVFVLKVRYFESTFYQAVKTNEILDLIRSKNTNEIVLKTIITVVFEYSFYFQVRHTNTPYTHIIHILRNYLPNIFT